MFWETVENADAQLINMRNNTMFISNINILSKREYSLDKQAIRLKPILRILHIIFSKRLRKFVFCADAHRASCVIEN